MRARATDRTAGAFAMQRLAAGQVIHGRYVLEAMLGRGGMGSVWRARDRRLGRHVAVKFMAARLQGSAIARKRFEREASISSKLQSRHVVRIHDHGIEDATPFLVMELLEGEDLGARLQRQGRLAPDEATRVLVDVCRGLRRAHEAGLVHRDLKPANVFLARDDDGTETAKILDFGVVKTMASTFEASVATESGAIVGSVQYASPEQAEGLRDLDARSDLWSVGALAFRVLTGRLPFPGEALGTVVLAICTKPLPRATEVAPDLPAALDAFFDRAFQRDRGARFQTALELSDALIAALHGEWAEGRRSAPSVEGDEAGAATRVIDLAAAAQRSVLLDETSPPGDAAGVEPDDGAEPTRTIDATPPGVPDDEARTQLIDVAFDAERSTGSAIVSPIVGEPGRRRRLAQGAAIGAGVLVAAGLLVAWLGGDGGGEPAPAGAPAVEASPAPRRPPLDAPAGDTGDATATATRSGAADSLESATSTSGTAPPAASPSASASSSPPEAPKPRTAPAKRPARTPRPRPGVYVPTEP